MINWEIIILVFSFALVIIFCILNRKETKNTLREIPAFSELQKKIELSVEDGTRLQVSLGSSGLLGPQSVSFFTGLILLRQVARVAADSDQPPIATNGDGLQNILAHDVLRSTYKELGLSDEYHHRLSRVTGLTPSSYAAGTMPLILDNFAASSALIGSFREEAGLITAATQRRSAFSTGGTESLSGQSVLFAVTEHVLLGEEIFATGAYLDAGRSFHASLRMQDTLRWIIVVAILAMAIFKLLVVFI
jgi:hypothetical protein